MLAQWISKAVEDGYTRARREPLITLGSAPLGVPEFRSVVLVQLGESRLLATIDTDIAGERSHARTSRSQLTRTRYELLKTSLPRRALLESSRMALESRSVAEVVSLATRYWLIPSGARNSSCRTSPGWIGDSLRRDMCVPNPVTQHAKFGWLGQTALCDSWLSIAGCVPALPRDTKPCPSGCTGNNSESRWEIT